jgi:hypothetical protein
MLVKSLSPRNRSLERGVDVLRTWPWRHPQAGGLMFTSLGIRVLRRFHINAYVVLALKTL